MSKISNIEYYACTIWQVEKCNLLWEDSVSTRSRLECDRFQRYTTYLLRALLYLHSRFDWIKDKEKKTNVSRRRIEQQFKRNRPPASNIRACPRVRPGQLSRNEATRQVDARDGICALRGTPAECILRVADVKRLKGSETCPTHVSRL